MSVAIQFMLTSVGQLAVWNAKKNGLSLDLTHIQLGSGNRTPDGLEVALVQPQEAAAIAGGSQITPTQVRMAALFSSNAEYEIREIGLWAGNPATAGSVLVGYWSQAAGVLAIKAAGVDFVFSHDMVLDGAVPAGTLNILADTSQAPLLAMIAAHEAKANPHPQYALATDLTTVIPAGTEAFFATPTAPTGWLKENGAAVSRVAFARLFAAIGTRYGAGDGVNTFNVPDARGEFFRALDDGVALILVVSWGRPNPVRRYVSSRRTRRITCSLSCNSLGNILMRWSTSTRRCGNTCWGHTGLRAAMRAMLIRTARSGRATSRGSPASNTEGPQYENLLSL